MAPPALALHGPMTIAQAAALREQLLHALAGGTTALDLAEVSEFDSAGVQLLLAAQHSAATAGQAFGLCAASPVVREVLQLLGLQALLAGPAA